MPGIQMKNETPIEINEAITRILNQHFGVTIDNNSLKDFDTFSAMVDCGIKKVTNVVFERELN